MEPVAPSAVSGEASAWLRLRQARRVEDERFHGIVGARPAGVYAVSRVERYLQCPFRYFAETVLRLGEERDEEPWMSPQERGVLVHELFERFFAEWQSAGRGAISNDALDEAVAVFRRIAAERLEHLAEGDRALERTFVFGSAAAQGLAERAFAVEADDPRPVVERLLEHELDGTFAFAGVDGVRDVALRAKADRIDLLADGTLRIVDYKIGRAPHRKRALQLAVYGATAEQALRGHRARDWTVSRAGYVAFKEKGAFAELGRDLPAALADAQARSWRPSRGSSGASSRPPRRRVPLRLVRVRLRLPQGLRRR